MLLLQADIGSTARRDIGTRPAATGRSARPHLVHVFPSFAHGGQQSRFVTLANALWDRYRHTVLALDGELGGRDRLDPVVDCRTMAQPMAKGRGVDPAQLLGLRRRLAELRPDLLLTYNWGAIEWAFANRWRPLAPHLHFEDGFGPEEAAGRQLRRRVLFRRLALGGPTRVIVPSQTLRHIALECWRLDPARVLYVPNGLDCARFDRLPDPDASERLARRPGDLVIGTVGALRPEKNFGRLLRAFAALAPGETRPRLAVVGEGPERAALEALAAGLGIADRVLFFGAVERPEGVLGLFDLFALSSDTEQMPYTILEAMAAGLPVVATDVGDIKSMVAAENGDMIVPRDEEGRLVGALQEMVDAADRRRRIGAANRQRVRALFDEQTMVATYDALFARTAGAGAG